MQKTTHESRTRGRAPVARTARKLVDAIEDVVDEAVTRGEGVERDARRLVSNLLRSRDEGEKDGGDEPPRRAKR